MKKSALIFIMLFAAVLFVSCEENDVLVKQSSATKDSVLIDSASIARGDTLFGDTIQHFPGDTLIDNHGDTITIPPKYSIDRLPIQVDLAGDDFTLTPSAPDSLSGKGIMIQLAGSKSYSCQNNQLQYQFDYEEQKSTFSLNLLHVLQPQAADCLKGEIKITAGLSCFFKSGFYYLPRPYYPLL